jgi:hypothetical protein
MRQTIILYGAGYMMLPMEHPWLPRSRVRYLRTVATIRAE